MTRRCPRCKEYIPSDLYEEPVSICLVCYARIPSNAGLTLIELREKAHKSFPAMRRKKKEDARELLAKLTNQPYTRVSGSFLAIDEELQHAKDAGLESIDCDFCKASVQDYYMRMRQGLVECICLACKETEIQQSLAK
jgi:hypothetical protein